VEDNRSFELPPLLTVCRGRPPSTVLILLEKGLIDAVLPARLLVLACCIPPFAFAPPPPAAVVVDDDACDPDPDNLFNISNEPRLPCPVNVEAEGRRRKKLSLESCRRCV